MTTSVIDRMECHLETVSPGLPFEISAAADVGDGVWQGDLGLEIVAGVPAGYERVKGNSAKLKQLVRGSTEGSRHCLDSLRGVELYHPANWTDESLVGPCFITKQQRVVQHPKHGDVTVPAGTTILCRYQREFDSEQRRERRNQD